MLIRAQRNASWKTTPKQYDVVWAGQCLGAHLRGNMRRVLHWNWCGVFYPPLLLKGHILARNPLTLWNEFVSAQFHSFIYIYRVTGWPHECLATTTTAKCYYGVWWWWSSITGACTAPFTAPLYQAWQKSCTSPPPSPLHRKEHTLTYLLAVRCSITMLRSAVHGAKVTQTGSAGIPLPYLSVLRETLHRLSQ